MPAPLLKQDVSMVDEEIESAPEVDVDDADRVSQVMTSKPFKAIKLPKVFRARPSVPSFMTSLDIEHEKMKSSALINYGSAILKNYLKK